LRLVIYHRILAIFFSVLQFAVVEITYVSIERNLGVKNRRNYAKIVEVNRLLVLHLKRYSYNMLMSRQAKAGQNITIPRYLTLQSHCEEETRPPFPTIPPPEPKR
jgi:hypothetical protein